MTIEEIRKWVIVAYPGMSWARKVNAMADNQVIAIYYNMKKKGAFDRPVKKEQAPDDENYQYTIFDFGVKEKL